MDGDEETRDRGEHRDPQDTTDFEDQSRSHEDDEEPGAVDKGGPKRAGALADEADDERQGVIRPPEGLGT